MEPNQPENKPRSRFRKNRSNRGGEELEANDQGRNDTVNQQEERDRDLQKELEIERERDVSGETEKEREREMLPAKPTVLERRDTDREQPKARSRVPSIEIPEPKITREISQPKISNFEEDPRSFISGPTSNQDEVLNVNPGDEDDEDADEETGLIRHQPKDPATTEEPKTDQVKVFQDINGQVERIKSLRLFNNMYPLRLFLPCLRMGYQIDPLYRIAQFVDVYKSLNLEKTTAGLNLGVIIKQINTFKDHIIGLVKPIVRVSAVNIETGFFIHSLDESPLKPVSCKGKLAVNNCSKVIWNDEVTLDAPFCDLVSESTILFFEIIDQRTSLSIKQKGNQDANKNRYHYKKIAWAYLLPIGIDGRMNINYYPPAADQKLIEAKLEVDRVQSDKSRHSNLASPTPTATQQQQQLFSPGGGTLLNPTVASQYQVKNDLIDNHLRLQLYNYHSYDGIVGFVQRKLLSWPSLNPAVKNLDEESYPNNVPPIYLQWKLLKRSKIEGAFLEVGIGSRVRKMSAEEKLIEGAESGSDGMSPRSRKGRRDRGLFIITRRKRKLKVRSKEERNRLKNAAIRRHRNPKEPCLIPDRFLQRIYAGPEGAMSIAYSHCGHLLAVASKTTSFNVHLAKQEIVYSLRLFDTDLDEEIWLDEAAHHGTIYEIKWSKNDRFLLTCSNDGTCKVWDLIAVHPLMQQYSPPLDDDLTANPTPGPLSGFGSPFTPTPHHPYESLEDQSVDLSYLQQHHLSPRSLAKMYPPRIFALIRLPGKVYSYTGLFQEFPPLAKSSAVSSVPFTPSNHFGGDILNSMIENPLLDYVTWKDQILFLLNSLVPRMIIGCSDGRIRVFEAATSHPHNDQVLTINNPNAPLHTTTSMIGLITVQDRDEAGNLVEIPPHNGSVNSLVIDERSKYLISGDSYGDILAWRLDQNQWYQLLRKFKKDIYAGTASSSSTTNNNNNNTSTGSAVPSKYAVHYYENQHSFSHGSILSLAMHPERNKGLMLVLSRQPSQLKVINMTTYKTLSYCENFLGVHSYLIHENDEDYSTGMFYRASFSADGRYIICCVSVQGSSSAFSNVSKGGNSAALEKGLYQLVVWDSFTGHPVHTPLSNLTFPYPIRSTAWHPSQHLLAVSMVGPSAAVVLYCTNRDTAHDSSYTSYNPLQQQATFNNPTQPPSGLRSSANSLHASTDNLLMTGKSDIQYSILESMNSTLNTQGPTNNNKGIAAVNLPPSRLNATVETTSSSALTTPMNSIAKPDPFAGAKNPIIAAARPLAKAAPTSAKEIEEKGDRAANSARARELLNKYKSKTAANATTTTTASADEK